MNDRNTFRFDLLTCSPIRRFVRWRGFPLVFQLLTLGAVLGVVVIGFDTWPKGPDPMAYARTLRKTNLATLLVWGLWWPGILVVTILLGRLWCTVCPMELVSQVSWRLGRRLGLARAVMPRWVRAGWVVLLGYIALQLLVAGFAFHRIPALTSWMLLAILAIALAVGLLFREPRAFCRGFCPAAALLDAYGRLSPINSSNRSAERCQTCQDKPCIDPATRARWNGRGCPSLALPFARDDGDNCVLCFQCAKTCPHDNVGFGWPRGRDALSRTAGLSLSVGVFVFLAFGFVAHEVFAEVKPLDHVFHLPAWWVSSLFGAAAVSKWAEAAWFLFGLPALLAGLILLMGRLVSPRAGWTDILIRAAVALVPVVAVAHAAKAVAKVSSWAPFLPGSLGDPRGVAAAEALLSGRLVLPVRLISLQVVGFLALVVMFGGVLVILVRARSPSRGFPLVVTAAMLATVALYATCFLGWMSVIRLG